MRVVIVKSRNIEHGVTQHELLIRESDNEHEIKNNYLLPSLDAASPTV